MINYANRGQKIDMIRINNKSGTVIELCQFNPENFKIIKNIT